MKKYLESLFSLFFTVLLIVGMVWAEFGGIYHAFNGHGIAHGFSAVIIPPVAWYRSIEFFFHEQPPSIPEEFEDDREEMLDSLSLLLDATKLRNKWGERQMQPTTKQNNEMLEMMKNGIIKSQLVSEDYLDYLHPDFSKYYRSKLILGSTLLYGALQAKGEPMLNLPEGYYEIVNKYTATLKRKYKIDSLDEGAIDSLTVQIIATDLLDEWADWWLSVGREKEVAEKIF